MNHLSPEDVLVSTLQASAQVDARFGCMKDHRSPGACRRLTFKHVCSRTDDGTSRQKQCHTSAMTCIVSHWWKIPDSIRTSFVNPSASHLSACVVPGLSLEAQADTALLGLVVLVVSLLYDKTDISICPAEAAPQARRLFSPIADMCTTQPADMNRLLQRIVILRLLSEYDAQTGA
uniref:Uncharacterized protein n=1 Tax=Eutreptiella gymnastica TaxID=73025 RepID=A0A7S4G720_9EUGL